MFYVVDYVNKCELLSKKRGRRHGHRPLNGLGCGEGIGVPQGRAEVVKSVKWQLVVTKLCNSYSLVDRVYALVDKHK